MIHHGNREDYAVAASRAAQVGREKMANIIERGRATAMQVVEQVQSQVPRDRIALARKLTVQPTEVGFDLVLPELNTAPIPLHEHALGQVSEKAGLDSRYLSHLREKEGWGPELAAYNMNQLLAHSDNRHLIRTINDREVRGVLSDRFRRLDSRPLLDAFMGACQQIGAVPIEGFALDTKVRMRAVLPVVFEPVRDEVMLFGIQWGNSDFGDGSHGLSMWCMRILCTNTALTNEVLRQVHLGKRLEDNISYSQRTYQLDTQANASALGDVVQDALSPVKINGYLEHIKTAAAQQIDHKDVTRVLKAKLGKGDAEQVENLFNSPDVMNLPAGSTTYRLSNAISFFSQGKDLSPHKKLLLQEIAGQLLPGGKEKVREV